MLCSGVSLERQLRSAPFSGAAAHDSAFDYSSERFEFRALLRPGRADSGPTNARIHLTFETASADLRPYQARQIRIGLDGLELRELLPDIFRRSEQESNMGFG